jgi:mannose-6-phosphate isomerase
MDVYPLTFYPLYKEKIWGGRNLERLFDRELPDESPIGESWELADLPEGVSIVANGPQAGWPLTQVTSEMGNALLGRARPMPDGRFPLLLKLLDANDILSLQVHPDAEAVAELGPEAALKTECWYVVESRDGFIYKGVMPDASPDAFRAAIERDEVEPLVRKVPCSAGDFHYLPAGTVHALGAGLVVAEVQTPSDTTYRVTDWGRGREIHVERSMQCIHFTPAGDDAPGAEGDTLLVTDYFTVARHEIDGGERTLPPRRCTALMMLEADGATLNHDGEIESELPLRAGQTVLVPAELHEARLEASGKTTWLEITLPQGPTA